MVDVAKLLEPVSHVRRRRFGPLVLELDLTEGITDETPTDPVGQLMAKRHPQLADIVTGIRRGARDDRVRALVAKIDGKPLGFAKVQELRETVRAFRAAGKTAVAWSESFGDVGPGTLPYYLATAFDEIVLQPTGSLGLTGLSFSSTFVADAADKLGVEYEVGARHEYKTAVNTVTQRGFTEPHRETVSRLVSSLTEQVTAGIAEGRGMTTSRVDELVGSGPLLAEEAHAAGLVDRLGYRDEVYAELFDRFGPARGGTGDTPHLQYVSRYQHSAGAVQVPQVRPGNYVAAISANGVIVSGRSHRAPVGGASYMGADTVAAAFRAARRDPNVRAVVFRVDSRGGSAVASDVIRREIRLTRESGTPVVAAMGDFAASGGYYVALGADSIVAHPGTLTGSIGVYAGKAVLSGLMDKLGVATDSVDGGKHAGMFHTDRGFTESEWERMNATLDSIYDDFTAKVAEARGMTRQRVDELARGRVWTGQDAHAGGLVDELGGIATAVRAARRMADLPPGTPLRRFPQVNPLERLVPPESSEERTAAAQLRLDAWGPLAQVAARLGLPDAGPLVLPGSWEVS
ncbi:signal peptide peptidase SppA [Haloactinospora alba]|nr:signal peptide peptidase SppA [Haloactinospora alba]